MRRIFIFSKKQKIKAAIYRGSGVDIPLTGASFGKLDTQVMVSTTATSGLGNFSETIFWVVEHLHYSMKLLLLVLFSE